MLWEFTGRMQAWKHRRNREDHDLVTVKIGDGMGNQMYNYACGYAAAKRSGEKLRLDISECDNSTLRDYELDHFRVVYDEKESFPNRTFWQKLYKRLRRDIRYHVSGTG